MSPARRRGTWWGERPAGAGHRPAPARGPGSRRGFGRTWWGRAWIEALENRAALDPNRLPRGRGYARRGTVSGLTVEPGEVRAAVQGTRSRPYDVVVRVRQYDVEQWNRVLDAIAARVGHAAALLDGELPPEVVDDAEAAGLSLLPGPGELQPRCSCPDAADPCKHSASVCYLVADLLDADPFALLTLRGRTREEVLASLRQRRASGPGQGGRTGGGGVESGGDVVATGETDEGVHARTAFAREAAGLPALPVLPLPPERPGRPAAAALVPSLESGVARDALVALAADATRRAWEVATGDGDGGLALTFDEDLARRAAALLGADGLAGLARRAGLPSRELARRALAWRSGGPGGLAALLTSWRPEAALLADGRAALLGHPGLTGPVRARGERLTRGSVQLRLGQDRLWYRFHRSVGDWDLVTPASADPCALLRDTNEADGEPAPQSTGAHSSISDALQRLREDER